MYIKRNDLIRESADTVSTEDSGTPVEIVADTDFPKSLSYPPSEFMKIAGMTADVRSPSEYAEGTLPGAVNIPLFSNEERGLVGTVYKQYGKESAVRLGYEIINPGLDNFYRRLTALISDKPVGIVCARGGMRSGATADFLLQRGISAVKMEGGYKAYRNYTLKRLSEFSFLGGVFVIHGYTGAGKTELLEFLPNSIDLEGISGHRSSLFGGIGLTQATQKNFEALLLKKLEQLDLDAPVFFEGESRKIGNIHIPHEIYRHFKQAVHIFLDTSFETRIKNTLKSYGAYTKECEAQFIGCIERLRYFIGTMRAAEIKELFMRGKYAETSAVLMREYYDRKYHHTYQQYQFSLTVSGDDMIQAAKAIQIFSKQYQIKKILI